MQHRFPDTTIAILGLMDQAEPVSPELVMAAKSLGLWLGQAGVMGYVAADEALTRYLAEGGERDRLQLVSFSPASHVQEHRQTYRFDTTWIRGLVCTGSAGTGYRRTMLHSVRYVAMVGDYRLADAVWDEIAPGTMVMLLTDADANEVHRHAEHYTIGRNITLVVAETLPLALANISL